MRNLDGVSRETSEKLEHYLALLQKWNPKINLVANSTIVDAWERHFIDSAQILRNAPGAPNSWCDLGSGGGFPGLVIAILADGMGLKTDFTLIESDSRKSTFLRTVSRETGVRVKVVSERIETAEATNSDVVTARALAPMERLLPWVLRHLHPDGVALLPKGRRYQQELDEVRDNYEFSLEIIPSQVDSDSVILKLGSIRNV